MYFLESLPYSDGYIFRTMRNKFFTNNQINQCDVFNFIRKSIKENGLEKKFQLIVSEQHLPQNGYPTNGILMSFKKSPATKVLIH